MKKLIHGLVVAVALAVSVTAASAIDAKSYSGTHCRSFDADDVLVANSYGAVWNWAATDPEGSTSQHYRLTARLRCPVVKDIIGKGVEKAQVWVLDQHPTLPVRCSLSIKPGHGEPAVVNIITRSSVGASDVPQRLDFGRIPHLHPGVIDLTCTVPPRYATPSNVGGTWSGILSYRVDEQ